MKKNYFSIILLGMASLVACSQDPLLENNSVEENRIYTRERDLYII